MPKNNYDDFSMHIQALLEDPLWNDFRGVDDARSIHKNRIDVPEEAQDGHTLVYDYANKKMKWVSLTDMQTEIAANEAGIEALKTAPITNIHGKAIQEVTMSVDGLGLSYDHATDSMKWTTIKVDTSLIEARLVTAENDISKLKTDVQTLSGTTGSIGSIIDRIELLESAQFIYTVFGEVPAGTVDDVNKVFTLAKLPVEYSERLFLNGIRITRGIDYTVSGTTITLSDPLLTYDILYVDYDTLMEIGQPSKSVYGEVPAGALDNANTIFHLLHAPLEGTERIYINGVRQTRTIDYEISDYMIRFYDAPESDDILSVDYDTLA